MGGDGVIDDKEFEQAIQAIQESLSNAELELSRLGAELQFLVGTGDIEIVRRGPTGETRRPKVVLAELKGCDPMLWRPEHPAWLRSLEVRSWGEATTRKGGNGQPTSNGGEEQKKTPEPPPSTPEEN